MEQGSLCRLSGFAEEMALSLSSVLSLSEPFIHLAFCDKWSHCIISCHTKNLSSLRCVLILLETLPWPCLVLIRAREWLTNYLNGFQDYSIFTPQFSHLNPTLFYFVSHVIGIMVLLPALYLLCFSYGYFETW